MKLISLDFDDMMYDLMCLNIKYVKEKYNVDIIKDINSYYYIWENYPTIMEDLWNHPENYVKGELIPGALEFYNKLVDILGVEKIQIVTSSMPDIIVEKNKMIKSLGIECDVVHSIFNGSFPKSFYTYGTVLIDDHTKNVYEHIYKNSYYGIVFNHMRLPYIKENAKKDNLKYAETYEELLDILKHIGVIN